MPLFQNESLCKALYGNEFENEPADETYFHENGYARKLLLTQRIKRSRKWAAYFNRSRQQKVNRGL